jgi:biotin synthase-related radical SAM superfamily protein
MKKAILITGGAVKVPHDLELPFRLSRSTAGPGAGTLALVLSFQGLRVKKAISRDQGEFELTRKDGKFALTRNGEPFLDSVEIQPTLYHSPEQAFFNIETSCIYDCKFCVSKKLDPRIVKCLDPEKIVEMIINASRRHDFKAVALTSAVVGSPSETVEKMAYIVSRVREQLDPEIPIGVEPYVDSYEQIEMLKAAGADEIKINIETFDRDIFKKVCNKLEFDTIIRMIRYAVRIFGTGKVCSNIIVGLGETDENVLEGVEHLAKLGCVATIRPLKINDLNRNELEEALGYPLRPVSPERLVRLASEQKMILELYQLSTLSFKTMCHACTCCDIVPFRDL